MAILSNHNEIIEIFLENSDLDTNLKTSDEKCALELSLTPPHSNFDLAKKLLDKGARPNTIQTESGDSLLHILTKSGLEESAVFLTEFANLNHVNRAGLTVLHLAGEKGFAKLVEALLKKGASPNIQSCLSELDSPLHYAVKSNSLNVINAMVDYRNNPESTEFPDFNLKNSSGSSPLSMALALGMKDVVPILIKGGADVNARNGQELTLLHQAILKEDSETAAFLLNQGADMNAITGDQETPLQLAIHCRLPSVVDALCTRGVSFSAPNEKGEFREMILPFE